jgi:hypothetical protein
LLSSFSATENENFSLFGISTKTKKSEAKNKQKIYQNLKNNKQKSENKIQK